MKAAVYYGRDVRVEDAPDATLREPTDALCALPMPPSAGATVALSRDLLIYGTNGRMGHEFMGIVDAVGAEVRTFPPAIA